MKKILFLILIVALVYFYKCVYLTGKFNKFLEKYPNSEYAQLIDFTLGEINFLRRHHKGAIFRYQRVIEKYKIEKYKKQAYYNMGLCYEEINEVIKAMKIYKELCYKYPQSYQAELARLRYEYLVSLGYKYE